MPLPPALVALQDRVRGAQADGQALCIVGGGSKDFYGEHAAGRTWPGATLSTRELRGLISYEPSELVVRAWSGTPLAELEAALAEQGQCLPFEPPHFGPQATLGGMVAAGLAGPSRVAVGGVRDYVLGASIVNGRGEWLSFGGQVMKNVAGYDVSRLMAGSWGRLGVLADISLKVLPVAPATASFEFSAQQSTALQQLNQWAAQALPINASAWWAEAPEDAKRRGRCRVRLRGAALAVRSALASMAAASGGQFVADDEAQSFWAACREHQFPLLSRAPAGLPEADLWRLSLPATAPVLADVDGTQLALVEWHGAQRWVWADASAAAELRAWAQSRGGFAELFRRGAGAAPAVPRLHPLAPANAQIAARLKAAFDPAGVFNPGR